MMQPTDLAACAKLLVRMEERNPTSVQGQLLDAYTDIFIKCNLIQQTRLIIDVHELFNVKNGRLFYLKLCRHLILSLDGFNRGVISSEIEDLLECFLKLDEPEILRLFIRKLVEPVQGNNKLLQVLLASQRVFELLSQQKFCYLLVELVDGRMSELRPLSSIAPFNWKMTNAVFPSHYPDVIEFLRSDQQYLTRMGFNDLNHARNFARKYFGSRAGDTLKAGYSAIAQAFGSDARARCEIVKTLRLYEARKKEAALVSKEVHRLAGVRAGLISSLATA